MSPAVGDVPYLNNVEFPDNIDYNRLSFEVPGTRKDGQTGHFRNAVWPEMITPDNQPLHTLQDLWNSGLARAPNGPCLGWRKLLSTEPLKYDLKFTWLTYSEVDVRRRNLGSALHHWFSTGKLVRAEGGYETVGLWSINRPEWQIVDLAVQAYGMVSVSLYDTLGADSVEYIINHATLSVIFATPEKITDLLRIAAKLPNLKLIVSIDPLNETAKPLLRSWAGNFGIQIFDQDEFEAFGAANLTPVIPAISSQVTSICYTSGTTGNPKGALITHGNLTTAVLSNVHGGTHAPGGALFSYLPLAHIYERFCEQMAFGMGHPIGFFSGDHNNRLLEDAQLLVPEYFPSVPRVLNKVYAGAAATLANGGFRAFMLQKALDAKLPALRDQGERHNLFWDKLVFRKVRGALGGKIRMIGSGSAPISPEVLDFLKVSFGADVIEGYGMTETCGTACRTYPDDNRSGGTVGAPQPVNEVKLVDVPEMGYTSKDKPFPRGELCTRGANNTIGYYKDPENTKKAIDSEGWLHTGDVAAIDGSGRVAIIDRVKNIMKLSQGEYVALEKIENIYSTVTLLQTIFIYGDSLRDHLVAVVVPEPGAIVDLASRLKIVANASKDDRAALDAIVAHPQIHAEIVNQMNIEANKAGLKGFEKAKRIHVTNELFTPENGLLTATFKIKRKDAYNHYKKEIDAMYALN